jgi:hypothetical protein
MEGREGPLFGVNFDCYIPPIFKIERVVRLPSNCYNQSRTATPGRILEADNEDEYNSEEEEDDSEEMV